RPTTGGSCTCCLGWPATAISGSTRSRRPTSRSRASSPTSWAGDVMNGTVARLTVRTVLGRRRALLLLILPGVLLLLSVLVRLTAGSDPDITVGVLGAFALAVVVPLLGLI